MQGSRCLPRQLVSSRYYSTDVLVSQSIPSPQAVASSSRSAILDEKYPTRRSLAAASRDRKSKRTYTDEESALHADPWVRMAKSPPRQCIVSRQLLPSDFMINFRPARVPTSFSLPDAEETLYLFPDRILHPRFTARRAGKGVWASCNPAALDALQDPKGRHLFATKNLAPHLKIPKRLTAQVGSQLQTRVGQELDILRARIIAASRRDGGGAVEGVRGDVGTEIRDGQVVVPYLRWITSAEAELLRTTNSVDGIESLDAKIIAIIDLATDKSASEQAQEHASKSTPTATSASSSALTSSSTVASSSSTSTSASESIMSLLSSTLPLPSLQQSLTLRVHRSLLHRGDVATVPLFPIELFFPSLDIESRIRAILASEEIYSARKRNTEASTSVTMTSLPSSLVALQSPAHASWRRPRDLSVPVTIAMLRVGLSQGIGWV